jgi:membrane protease YdiL (CAAX protease family)
MELAAVSRQGRSAGLSPMPFWQSIAFFGIPWLFFVVCIHILVPALYRAGIPIFLNFLISLGIPLGLLILASCVAYRREGWPWTWSAFRDRFRLGAMHGSTWLWAIGLSVFMFLAPAFLSFTSALILQMSPMSVPLQRMFDIRLTSFMGNPLSGAWWVFVGYLAYLALNVFGEELWWRGYILPRQELAFGKWTWLVHGLFWNLFHSFFYWELIALLPGCLALSYIAHRTKSTWPGILAHFSISLPTIVLIVMGVLR